MAITKQMLTDLLGYYDKSPARRWQADVPFIGDVWKLRRFVSALPEGMLNEAQHTSLRAVLPSEVLSTFPWGTTEYFYTDQIERPVFDHLAERKSTEHSPLEENTLFSTVYYWLTNQNKALDHASFLHVLNRFKILTTRNLNLSAHQNQRHLPLKYPEQNPGNIEKLARALELLSTKPVLFDQCKHWLVESRSPEELADALIELERQDPTFISQSAIFHEALLGASSPKACALCLSLLKKHNLLNEFKINRNYDIYDSWESFLTTLNSLGLSEPSLLNADNLHLAEESLHLKATGEAVGIISAVDTKLLNQAILEKLFTKTPQDYQETDYINATPLVEALSILSKQPSLFTAERLNILITHAWDSVSIANALIGLHEHHLLEVGEPIIAEFSTYFDPTNLFVPNKDTLGRVCNLMNLLITCPPSLITQANLLELMEDPKGTDRAMILSHIARVRPTLLNQEVFEEVLRIQNPDIASAALAGTKKFPDSTQQLLLDHVVNLSIFLKFTNWWADIATNYNRYNDPRNQEMVREIAMSHVSKDLAEEILQYSTILNHINTQRLTRQHTELTRLLNLCRQYSADQALAIQKCQTCVLAYYHAEVVHFTNPQTTIDQIIENSAVFTQITEAISHIPTDRLTQAIFDRLLQICRENPDNIGAAVAACNAYLIQVRNQRVAAPTRAAEPLAHALQGEQSTHTKSVNRSSVRSAARLQRHYASQIISEPKKNAILGEIRTWLEALPKEANAPVTADQARRNKFAYACFQRMVDGIGPHGTPEPSRILTQVKPHGFNISLGELMCLSWLAVQDDHPPHPRSREELATELRVSVESIDEQDDRLFQKLTPGERLSSKEDALNLLAEGFYEIAMDGNLDEQGREVDPTQASASGICAHGTFNKFIEKLAASISPLAFQRMITREQAASKLPLVARKAACAYLREQITAAEAAGSVTADTKKSEITDLIKAIRDDGTLKKLQAFIKDKVADALWSEFSEVPEYADNKDGEKFQELLSHIQYAGLYHSASGEASDDIKHIISEAAYSYLAKCKADADSQPKKAAFAALIERV